MKVCSQCSKRVHGLKYLRDFPRDELGFCSFNCMFLWIREHNLKCNGETIMSLSNKKGVAVYAQDY